MTYFESIKEPGKNKSPYKQPSDNVLFGLGPEVKWAGQAFEKDCSLLVSNNFGYGQMAVTLKGLILQLIGIIEWSHVTWKVVFGTLAKATEVLAMGSYSQQFEPQCTTLVFKSMTKTKWYKVTMNGIQVSMDDMKEALVGAGVRHIRNLFNVRVQNFRTSTWKLAVAGQLLADFTWKDLEFKV